MCVHAQTNHGEIYLKLKWQLDQLFMLNVLPWITRISVYYWVVNKVRIIAFCSVLGLEKLYECNLVFLFQYWHSSLVSTTLVHITLYWLSLSDSAWMRILLTDFCAEVKKASIGQASTPKNTHKFLSAYNLPVISY